METTASRFLQSRAARALVESGLSRWGRRVLRIGLALILSALAGFGAYSFVADYERLALPKSKIWRAEGTGGAFGAEPGRKSAAFLVA